MPPTTMATDSANEWSPPRASFIRVRSLESTASMTGCSFSSPHPFATCFNEIDIELGSGSTPSVPRESLPRFTSAQCRLTDGEALVV